MCWLCAENCIDNREMFSLLLSSTYTVKASSASPTTQPANGLGVHKKLGGDTAGTADPNGPKGYSIPYDIMLSI